MATLADVPHRIVVVGGGAGGLELVTRLGNRLGRSGKAHVTLIDRRSTHLWKPLLHEVAAGSMDLGAEKLDYLAQAHWHHFTFRLGGLIGIDRARRTVRVARHLDAEGREVLPEHDFPYDTLVIAIGSLTNDFGTRGVKAHAIPLETPDQAERFHTDLVNACLRANTQPGPLRPGQLNVAIIGAGATGTELAAELHKTTRQLVAFGLDRIDPDKDIKIHLIEAAPRILPALPERLSAGAAHLLDSLKVAVHTGALVTEVTAEGVTLGNGRFIPAELVVWAAGIKAPDLLKDIAGLETNKLNQLVVRPTLQTTRDDAIFAFGDCAACPWPDHKSNVPPRAQAAHQQASFLARQLSRRIAGMPLKEWQYRDFGSLVSLGEYSTVGNLMGRLVGGNLFIEGWFAGLMYKSLYKMHQLALHGPTKVALDTTARIITRRTEPVVKLH
ncbi:MAG TPA: NAD(P)/FAD-dependent oxidoreductase [Hyphomicrobiaceae bacterium]|nr:NAD(P)/FAD-dependent oxidoreductase [Hyphomicrobiaceae bacterium]